MLARNEFCNIAKIIPINGLPLKSIKPNMANEIYLYYKYLQSIIKGQVYYWKRVDKHIKIFDCGLMSIFPKVSQKYRLILVKGQKIKERRNPKNQRKQGKGYRSYRMTYS